MTASEVFSRLSSRLVRSMMLNEKMADYYDFLGLMGFKRLHEYHFLKDTVELRGIHRYFINHFGRLLPDVSIAPPDWSIPASWFDHTRDDVVSETKKNAVRIGMEKWCEWAKETKSIYEQSYSDLCEIGEVSAAIKVKELVCAADMACKCADRLYIKLKGIDYDMPTICIMQDEIHSEYAENTKGIGVNIC